MSRAKKSDNIEIGMRLRTIRINLGMSQADFAECMEISDEHYRKIENGSSGLTLEKLKMLYDRLNIDPTYLVTGKQMDAFDLDKYLVNSRKEQRDNLFRRCLAYIESYITG